MSSPYPSIPDPQNSVESVAETVRALKMAVEMLSGQRRGGPAAHVFVQLNTPTAISAGDLWIDPIHNSIIRYWTGTEWLKLTIV